MPVITRSKTKKFREAIIPPSSNTKLRNMLPDRLKHWEPIIEDMDIEQLKKLRDNVEKIIQEKTEQEKRLEEKRLEEKLIREMYLQGKSSIEKFLK